MHGLRLVVVSFALMALMAASVAAVASGRGEAGWAIRDLGTLVGQEESVAVGVNERGQVIGNLGRDLIGEAGRGGGALGWEVEETRGFVWESGRMVDLGSLGGEKVTVAAINDVGQVTGTSATRGREWPHAFVWQNGRMTDLGTLGRRQPGGPVGSARSQAVAINDRGQIVGFSDSAVGQRAFLWERGRMKNLGGLGGESQARAINNRGQVAGSGEKGSSSHGQSTRALLWSDGRVRNLGSGIAFDLNDLGCTVGAGARHAVLWRDGRQVDLGALPDRLGSRPGDPDSVATAINERGQIIGSSISDLGYPRGFLWETGVMSALPGDEAMASSAGLNEKGQIVGSRETISGRRHATLWDGTRVIDLGTLPGGGDSHALDINGNGEIVGWATTQTGHTHAVLWTLRR